MVKNNLSPETELKSGLVGDKIATPHLTPTYGVVHWVKIFGVTGIISLYISFLTILYMRVINLTQNFTINQSNNLYNYI